MSKKWLMAALVAILLIAPALGVIAGTFGLELAKFEEKDVDQNVLREAVVDIGDQFGNRIGGSSDLNADYTVPVGAPVFWRTNIPGRKLLVLVGPSRDLKDKEVVQAEICESEGSTLTIPADAFYRISEQMGCVTGRWVLGILYQDTRRHEWKFRLVFVFKGYNNVAMKKNLTLVLNWDNWSGWKPGQPIPALPSATFLRDRLTWNLGAEVSAIRPGGPEAGFDNLISKGINQSVAANSVFCRFVCEDGHGGLADGPGQIGVVFFTRKDASVPSAQPGAMQALVRLANTTLPANLRQFAEANRLQAWQIVWRGSRSSGTLIVSLAVRQAIADAFPDRPGMRKVVLAGVAGWTDRDNLPLSYGTDSPGEDVRHLIPAGALPLAAGPAEDEFDTAVSVPAQPEDEAPGVPAGERPSEPLQ